MTVESTSTMSLSLINRYLFFTFCQVTLCIFLSTLIINISYCSPINCKPGFITKILLRYLNRLLKINRPDYSDHFKIDTSYLNNLSTNSTARSSFSGFCYPSACQSLMSKYHLESSQSEIELHSRLVCSRKEEKPKPIIMHSSSSSSSKYTNSSSKHESSPSSSSSNSKESEKQNLVDKDNNSKLKTSRNNLKNDLSPSTNKSRPFEFQKAVHNLNSMANRIQNIEQYLKVCSVLISILICCDD